MTKSWPLLALAVLGAVAAVCCLAVFDWTAWACRLPSGEEGKVMTPGFGGCVEFWLNRYQTLVGAAAALIAGVLAWRGAMRQVAKADDQINLITKQFAVDKIDAINSKLILIDGLYKLLLNFHATSDRLVEVIKQIASGAAEVCTLIERGDRPGPYLGTVLEPLGRELMTDAPQLAALVSEICNTGGNPYLPENIKSALLEFAPEAFQRAEMMASYIPRLRSNIVDLVASSAPDALRAEYARVAEIREDLPTQINFSEREAFRCTLKERNRLRELRNAAEAAAEL